MGYTPFKMKGFPEFLLKKQRGPVETETKLTKKQQQEKDIAEHVDHNVGAKMDSARDFLRLESVEKGKIQN
jgi:hypothetical protein